MEHAKSKRSSGDDQPTTFEESGQPRSVVVVAVDATRDLTLAALQYTLKNLSFNPGDNLYVLGILHTTSSKLGINKVNPIGTDYVRVQKEAEFKKAIANDQEIQKLFDLKKLIPGVHIALGPDRKVVTAKQAMELRATWVILDKHLKDDKDYLMEHLNCNIIVLMGKNKATIIKIELPHVENSRVLEWKARWKTAVRTARGLLFLQEECQVSCLVHRDMRPTNILLTNAYVPMPQRENFGSETESQVNGVKAQEPKPFGNLANYLAPEHGECGGSIPEKADVYSFGILLLELITGRKANDTTKMPLTDWTRQMIHAGKTLDLVDPRLRDICDVDQVTKMVDAAGRCISKDPAGRPKMSEVLDILDRDTKNVGFTKGKATKDICNIPRNPTSKRSQINPIGVHLSRSAPLIGPLMYRGHPNGNGASDKIGMKTFQRELHARSLKIREDILGHEGKASSSSSPSSSSSQYNCHGGKSSFFKAPTYTPRQPPKQKLSYNDMVAAHAPKEKISYNEMV